MFSLTNFVKSQTFCSVISGKGKKSVDIIAGVSKLCLLRVTWVLQAWVATPPVAGHLKVSRLGGD